MPPEKNPASPDVHPLATEPGRTAGQAEGSREDQSEKQPDPGRTRGQAEGERRP